MFSFECWEESFKKIFDKNYIILFKSNQHRSYYFDNINNSWNTTDIYSWAKAFAEKAVLEEEIGKRVRITTENERLLCEASGRKEKGDVFLENK